MKIFMFVWLSCFVALPALAKNGSSSIGNHPSLSPWLKTGVASSEVTLSRGQLSDAKTGEPLLEIQPIRRGDLSDSKDKLANSTLGSAKGYEYLPTSEEAKAGAQNFWVVCQDEQSDECVQLKPLSRTNTKVLSVIGSLSK